MVSRGQQLDSSAVELDQRDVTDGMRSSWKLPLGVVSKSVQELIDEIALLVVKLVRLKLRLAFSLSTGKTLCVTQVAAFSHKTGVQQAKPKGPLTPNLSLPSRRFKGSQCHFEHSR